MKPSHACPLTGRHSWPSSAMGIGGVAPGVAAEPGRLLAAPTRPELEPRRFDLTPKQPHSRAAGEGDDLAVHAGRAEPHRPVRPQAGAGTATTASRSPAPSSTTTPPQASAKVLGSPWKFRQARPVRASSCPSCCRTSARSSTTSASSARCTPASTTTASRSRSEHRPHPSPAGRCSAAGSPTASGRESQNLPAYRRADRPGQPAGASASTTGRTAGCRRCIRARWSAPQEPRILNLDPPPHHARRAAGAATSITSTSSTATTCDRHPGELDLEARIASYELAARMQTAAKEALDICSETDATRRLYGLDEPATADYGTRCLIARRLVERGVRFVQVFTRNQFWDHHGSIRTALARRRAR